MARKSSGAEPFAHYLHEIQRNLSSGIAAEQTHRHALQDLLEALDPKILAFNDPKHIRVGAPDFTIRRKGNAMAFPVGWIETKDIGEDLDDVEKSDQLRRYLGLPSLILTDYLVFRWYTDGKRRLTARLADNRGRKIAPEPGGEQATRELLSAFLTHQVPAVASPKDLALRMARLAHLIRDLILRSFEVEPESGKLHKQFNAFLETLIPDLKPSEFADMYAQTIAYGLFAARCQPIRPGQKFSREHAAYLIPKTNPFLRKLFNEIAGPDLAEGIQPFVDDLVTLLRDTDIGAILNDFGRRTAKEDPVVHFYEDFLQAYDPALREMRGVYYTPEPVVSYIVRSVDQILKTEFGKPLGLADKDVLILDPACGTGTFLYFVIRRIYETLSEQGQKGQWNSYVSENLLRRIFGFELLIAPYAVAHLKLGLQLQDLGYKFESDERLGVYLTNTLEEAVKKAQQIFAFADAITEEASLAAEVKLNKKVMVVLGNPPYSGHSANRSWEVINGKKVPTFIGRILQDYYSVDGQPLGERNPKWLQDDYVKFIRFGQWRIERTGHGILGFITNHGYLDNPTFRGMRQQLTRAFTEISILDLHGNSKKKERAPDGSKDENVFDIQQGVAIALYGKKPGGKCSAEVKHADLWGTREAKYEFLSTSKIETTAWDRIDPRSPAYLFVRRNTDLLAEYEANPKVTDVFPKNAVGFQTHRDYFVISPSKEELVARIRDFVDKRNTDDKIRSRYFSHLPQGKYPQGDTRDWKLADSRKQLQKVVDLEAWITRCIRRPFDFQWYFHHPAAVEYGRPEIMNQLIDHRNVALLWTRPMSPKYEFSIFCASCAADQSVVGNKVAGAGGTYVAPLYLYDDARTEQYRLEDLPKGKGGVTHHHVNLDPKFLSSLQARIGLSLLPEGAGDLRKTFGPDDAFAYMYAIFHSPTFSKRYSALLKAEVPRVPLTSNKELFAALTKKGSELVSLHLLDSPAVAHRITRYHQAGDHRVEKVRHVDPNPKAGISSGRVYINTQQYFEGVPRAIWEFQIGGYQVCDKWLKARTGRQLSSDDIDHYQKIVVALGETVRIMREIDELIPGWPLP